ncbi:SH3 beta-barrel fold-containing protein [Fibrivirga algicola]|uniref:DUF2693 domain-containing protein n=1 Tax=Fibrivirga algicola TaxID=2950420 RepID=A0ABX0QEK2_9BACT|nr:SH3 beta-barrel fold-containing protein [Fibrivirga algicola]NID09407.1 hypothetical protein [Fibrivirga algicola]
MKSHVFTLAAALRRKGLSLSESLRKAWATVKLRASMAVKPTTFFYTKGDGTMRWAVGSLEFPATDAPGAVVRYYDMLARDYRSFRADRLIVD